MFLVCQILSPADIWQIDNNARTVGEYVQISDLPRGHFLLLKKTPLEGKDRRSH